MRGEDISATVLSHGSNAATGGSARNEVQGAEALLGPLGPDVHEGQVLGPYRLEQLLGEGSMGRVFRAVHTRLGRQVALKILRPSHTRDPQLVQRFFQEAQAVNRVSHEHIVEIFDFVEDPAAGAVYCVMELLEGEPLSSVLGRGALPLAQVQRVALQTCDALEAAHRVGVVHRDVKPDNLFLSTRDGTDFVKVLDFGVAKLLTQPSVSGTVDGTLIGTPTYMSPEQAAGLPVDVRADVYALGTLLFEMLTGKPPFPEKAFGPLVVQIITQAAPALPARLASGEPCPPPLARLVERCLAKDPAQRPQRMAEVAAALRDLDRATRAAAHTRRRVHLAAVVATVVVACTTAVVAAALPQRGQRAERPALAPVELTVLPGEVDAAAVPQAAAALEGPRVAVTVRSFPQGARVVRADTGAELGVTPLSLLLEQGEGSLALRLERAGYVPLVRTVSLKADGVLEVPLAKARSGAGQPRARAASRLRAE